MRILNGLPPEVRDCGRRAAWTFCAMRILNMTEPAASPLIPRFGHFLTPAITMLNSGIQQPSSNVASAPSSNNATLAFFAEQSGARRFGTAYSSLTDGKPARAIADHICSLYYGQTESYERTRAREHSPLRQETPWCNAKRQRARLWRGKLVNRRSSRALKQLSRKRKSFLQETGAQKPRKYVIDREPNTEATLAAWARNRVGVVRDSILW